MALLFNSFNSLFIGRLMLLIYFLLKQIKTICADTGVDFWHGPGRSAFNFIFIDYTDNIICIKNCSLHPCHFTARVRRSHHSAGVSLPGSSFPSAFLLHLVPPFSLCASPPQAGWWAFISFFVVLGLSAISTPLQSIRQFLSLSRFLILSFFIYISI